LVILVFILVIYGVFDFFKRIAGVCGQWGRSFGDVIDYLGLQLQVCVSPARRAPLRGGRHWRGAAPSEIL